MRSCADASSRERRSRADASAQRPRRVRASRSARPCRRSSHHRQRSFAIGRTFLSARTTLGAPCGGSCSVARFSPALVAPGAATRRAHGLRQAGLSSSCASRRATAASTAGPSSRSSCGASCSAGSPQEGRGRHLPPRLPARPVRAAGDRADVSHQLGQLARPARERVQRQRLPLPRDAAASTGGRARRGRLGLRRRPRHGQAPRLRRRPEGRREVRARRGTASARCRRAS